MRKLSIDVAARALRHAFGSDDRLYRDHLGQRVLADVEGSGEFRVEQTTVRLQIYVDGRLFDRPTPFVENMLVSTSQTGTVSLAVRTGCPIGTEKIVELPYEGCGWVLQVEEPVVLDRTFQIAPAPDEFLSLPFFWEIDGQGNARILALDDCQPMLIDSFEIDQVAELKARNWRVQNISKVSELSSSFPNGTPRIGPVASHLNSASWTCPVPADCLGLRLRRFYDRFHGRQRARVLVNGSLVGWWYDPGEDRQRRWAVSEFGIPAQHVQGLSEVEITVDPPAGAPLWSVGRIEVLGIIASPSHTDLH